jgi:LPS sulfotransferase NodH
MRKTLFIASEVRSGSTFVAESIAYHFSKVLGEWLFDLTREPFSHLRDQSSRDDILAIYDSLFSGDQNWAAAKIMCAALSIMVREARKAEPLRQALFGENAYWIVVRRSAKIRQAVSLAFARKTGAWHVYSADEDAEHRAQVRLKETEDALRSILLSDAYLTAFSTLISPDRKIEIIYEDFLSNPKPLIAHLHDILGAAPLDGGVIYTDETKIRRKSDDLKRQAESDFSTWFVQNYHDVES